MIHLIQAELHRVRTTRSLLAFPLSALAYVVLSFAPALTLSEEVRRTMDGNSLLAMLRGPGFVVAVALLLLGGLATASDLGHSTVVAMLVAAPRRRDLYFAKLASITAVAVVTALAVELLALVLGVAFLSANGVAITTTSRDAAVTAIAVAAVAVLYGSVGVSVGLLCREPTVAVGGAIAWIGIIEGAVPVVLRMPWLFRWLPSGAANSLLGIAHPPDDLLEPRLAALLLVMLCGVLTAVAASVFIRRDVA